MSLIYMGSSPGRLNVCRKHRHDYYELVLNLEGTGTAFAEGREYPFKAGTVQIIPPGVLHYKNSEEGFRDVYFCFDGGDGPWKQICAGGTPVTEDDADRTLESLMTVMLSRYIADKRDSILDGIYRLCLSVAAERFAAGHRDTAVEFIEQKLRAAFNDPDINITAVLSATGYDKDYIRRRFKKKTGVTPQTYVENLRLARAKELLSLSWELDLPLSEISLMCGYCDSRYFSRVFKQATGVTPGRYARQAQNYGFRL